MKKIILTVYITFCALSSWATIIYVNASQSSTLQNGTSWATAYDDLQDALAIASTEDSIWVAKGTYKPTTTTNRDIAFEIPDQVSVFGGLEGNEDPQYDLRLRDLDANETILSGDLLGSDVVTGTGSTLTISYNTENSYHVCVVAGVGDETVLDGFTISGGNANGSGSVNYNSQVISRNNGGGIVMRNAEALITQITLKHNYGDFGGGFFHSPSSFADMELSRSTVYNNLANYGAGVYLSSDSFLSNCIIYANKANENGGGIFINGNSSFIDGVTVSSNYAKRGGGTFIANASAFPPEYINTIIWGNSSNTTGEDNIGFNNSPSPKFYSCTIEGSFPSGSTGLFEQNTSTANPLFINPANADFRLQEGSPSINTGDSSPSYTDLIGNARTKEGIPDRGAYESGYMAMKIYVDSSATGEWNGTSWADAFSKLDEAFLAADSNDTIWVAKGTYYPTEETRRGISFYIPDSVKIYGGFAGTESAHYDHNLRDFSVNETILSGNIGVANDSLDNSYHVVFTKNVSSETFIDGFTIEYGNANGSSSESKSGGGWYNVASGDNTSSSPSIRNVILRKNTASFGAGLNNRSLSNGSLVETQIANCLFLNNKATQTGGAIDNRADSGNVNPTIVNSVFYDNSSANIGGAIFSAGLIGFSHPKISNSIFWENYENGVIKEFGVIAARNITITNSLIQSADCLSAKSEGGTLNCLGSMIFSNDPLFKNPANGDFSLLTNSPAINAGINDSVNVLTDFTGEFRVKEGIVDMGAFETDFQDFRYYVNANAPIGGYGNSWSTGFVDLQDALHLSNAGDEIWVAKGTYKPAATDRDSSFVIPDSIKVYGGFTGTESTGYDLNLRDFELNPSILDGNIGLSSDTTDNTKTLVLLENVSPETVVDGFTITHAYNTTSWPQNAPMNIKALYASDESSPIIANCIIKENQGYHGGGMAVYSNQGTASPSFTNVEFVGNESKSLGGGLYIRVAENGTSSVHIARCDFFDNKSSSSGGGIFVDSNLGATTTFAMTNSRIKGNEACSYGGGIYFDAYDAILNPSLTNCVVAGNKSGQRGGGISVKSGEIYEDNPEAQLHLVNCTLAGNNSETNGGGLSIDATSDVAANPTIVNTIIYGNQDQSGWNTDSSSIFISDASIIPDITYSSVSGITVANTADSNVIFLNSLSFIEQQPPSNAPISNSNYGLTTCEKEFVVLIDKGLNTANNEIFDVEGKARFTNARIDLGAYEYDGTGTLVKDGIGYFDLLEKLKVKGIQPNPGQYEIFATKSIEMLPGMTVESGAVFKAEIQDDYCLP